MTRVGIARWLSAPRRLWRRRGHGVHSPYAYELLRRVVAQPCSYYAFEQIDAMARKAGVSARMCRLLYRLCLHSAPRVVCCLGGEAQKIGEIVAAVLPPSAPKPVSADTDATVIFATAEALPALRERWQAMPHGMLFDGCRASILAGYPHLYHQKFEIWL